MFCVNFITIFVIQQTQKITTGSVAQWLEHLSYMQFVASSTLAVPIMELYRVILVENLPSFLGQSFGAKKKSKFLVWQGTRR